MSMPMCSAIGVVMSGMMLLLAFLAPASFGAEKPDDSALVESIIQAQKAAGAALDGISGSAVVKRSMIVKEFPGRSGRQKDTREGTENYVADFRLKGGMQRVTKHSYDPSTGQQGALMQDRIDDPESLWCYMASAKTAYHVGIKNSTFAGNLGDDFGFATINAPDGAPFEMILRSTYKYSQYWQVTTRDDGMMVIKGGGPAEGTSPAWESVYVLNPAADYRLVEYDKTADWGNGEKRTASHKVQWENVNGRWVPRSITRVSDRKGNPKDPKSVGDTLQECVIEFRSYDAGVSIDDGVFKMDAFNMPAGTDIIDHVAKAFYEYKGSVANDEVTGDLAKGISTTPADSSTPGAVPDQPDKPVEKPSTTAAEQGGLSTAAIWAISVFCAVCVIIAVVVALKLRARK